MTAEFEQAELFVIDGDETVLPWAEESTPQEPKEQETQQGRQVSIGDGNAAIRRRGHNPRIEAGGGRTSFVSLSQPRETD
jgi:hypothetical protein